MHAGHRVENYCCIEDDKGDLARLGYTQSWPPVLRVAKRVLVAFDVMHDLDRYPVARDRELDNVVCGIILVIERSKHSERRCGFFRPLR